VIHRRWEPVVSGETKEERKTTTRTTKKSKQKVVFPVREGEKPKPKRGCALSTTNEDMRFAAAFAAAASFIILSV